MRKLKFGKKQLLPLSLGLLLVPDANANFVNLVVNGDFENHTDYNGSGWNYFGGSYGGSVEGWSSGSTTIPLEVGKPGVYGVSGGDLKSAVMELDTTHNVVATQILNVSPGATLQLSFLYALRQGVNADSGTLKVMWNGIEVASLSPNSPAMTLASYSVTAGEKANTLSFYGTGTDDSYGALIDNVSAGVAPEPTTMIAGALLLLSFGASTIRILRKKRAA
jgi:hypothetical protein